MSRVTQARGDANQMPSMLGPLQSLKPTNRRKPAGSQPAAAPRTRLAVYPTNKSGIGREFVLKASPLVFFFLFCFSPLIL